MRNGKRLLLRLLLVLGLGNAQAQTILDLNQAIDIALEQSPSARVAKLNFMGKYWNYRSYKAELLPSFHLGGRLMNYNRSFVEARDAQTGEVKYVDNHSIGNSATLSIDQNIPFLGGTLSLESYLSRLDQLNYSITNYNSNPIVLSYTQPLRSYNTLRWRMKTDPISYERAKRAYLESMQTIVINTTSYFFSVLQAQSDYERALQSYEDRKHLYDMALKRHELTGGNSRSEIMQLELSVLNDEMTINNARLSLESAMFDFSLCLGLTRLLDVRLLPPTDVPDLQLEAQDVIAKARANSTHPLDVQLNRLNAEQSQAQAKSMKGLQMTLNANLGYSQTANNFTGVYSDVRDHEVVGVSFSLPIYDWGLSEGKVKMAKADLEVTLAEIEQAEAEFDHDIVVKVASFNNQSKQCAISRRARDIAEERYELVKHRFEDGSVTVTDLNTAQSEYESAESSYINQMYQYWSAYYQLQKTALYDFLHQRDIVASFDDLVK